MKCNTGINPSISFFNLYKSNLLKTRGSLFKELDMTSSIFGDEARKILEEKLISNNNTPLLGELFPWIIKDLVKADDCITHNISVGWLAIYLYTLFIDEYLDKPELICPNKFITGSLLAKTGLLKISHFTNNTIYESYVDNALSYSARNQQLDVSFQKDNLPLIFKEQYSEGKNYVILACAGALAAQNNRHAEFITSFSRTLLLTLQYLDDIADFEEDFYSKNYTVLLNDAFKDNPDFYNNPKFHSKQNLLSELIESGSLHRSLKKIINLLNESINLIEKYQLSNNSGAFDFFCSISTSCTILANLLQPHHNKFKYLPLNEREIILDNVENHISIIAQSS